MDKQSPEWLGRGQACEAAQNVLPGESPAAYDQLWQLWLSKYEPECEADLAHLSAVVNAAWRVRRAGNALLNAEHTLYRAQPDSSNWPHADIQRLSAFQRVHKEAETSFQRNLKLLIFLRNDEQKQRRDWEKAHPIMAAAMIKERAERAVARLEAHANSLEQKTIVRLDQWVEVRIVNGETVTELYPSNAALLERGKKMDPPADYVHRRISFPDGVPPEYNWIGAAKEGIAIQRMTIDTWRDLTEEEERRADGHISPVESLPRQDTAHGCDCAVCTRNREIVEENKEAA